MPTIYSNVMPFVSWEWKGSVLLIELALRLIWLYAMQYKSAILIIYFIRNSYTL